MSTLYEINILTSLKETKEFRLCNGDNDSPPESSKIFYYCNLLGF